MKKKLVVSMMVISVVAGALIGGAVAAFMDIETGEVSFQTGTLDLKTSDRDGVSQTFYATRMKPGQSVGPATIVLRNIGSIAGSTLDISVTYTESNDVEEPTKTPDQVAAVLEVVTLTYGGVDILSEVEDLNGNEYPDVEDLKNTDLTGRLGIGPAVTKDFVITIKLNTTDNDFQGHGVDLIFTFTLNQ